MKRAAGEATSAPMALALAAKKKEILQGEAKKLEQRLRDRTAVLSQLRRHHEELLNVNGQLQQRNRARRAKLDALQLATSQGSSPDSERGERLCSASVQDTTTINDKHSTMKTLLLSLVEQRQRLEQRSMGAEEKIALKLGSLRQVAQQLSEAKETAQLSMEDARSLHWELELERSAVAAAESRLRQVGQQLQLEILQLDSMTIDHQTKLAASKELSKIRDNFRAMAKEAYDQLLAEKVEATRCWRSTVGMMERHGPTCAKDNEVRDIQVQLVAELEHLTQSVSATKSARRELVFRIKQEKDMLSLTKSSVKAKMDQIEWLKRQQAFLEGEYRNLMESRTASEQAFHASVQEYKSALAKLEDQKAVAKSTVNRIESEIASSKADAKTLSAEISDERKRLNQELRKRRAKEQKQKSSSASVEVMRNEILSAQQILAKSQAAQVKGQELLDKLIVESKEQQRTLADIEKQARDDEVALEALNDDSDKAAKDISAAKELLRDVILQDPAFSDWENITEWVNQKVAEGRSEAHAQLRHDRLVSAKSLRERFEAKFKALDDKCAKMLGEKRSVYDGMVKKMQSTRNASTTTRNDTRETQPRLPISKRQARERRHNPEPASAKSARNGAQEKTSVHAAPHSNETIQPVSRLDAASQSNTPAPSPMMSPAPSLSSSVSSQQLATPLTRVSAPRQHGSSTRKKLNPRAKPQASGGMVTTPTLANRPKAQRSLSPSGECVSSGGMSQSTTARSSTADTRFVHDDKENAPPAPATSSIEKDKPTKLKQPQPQPKRRGTAVSQAAIPARGKLKVTKAKVSSTITRKKGTTKKLVLSGRKVKSSASRGAGIIGSTTMTPSTASSSSATRRFASDWLTGDAFSFD